MKQRYWLTKHGELLAKESQDRINQCIKDFVLSLNNKKSILECEKLAKDVLNEMIEAKELLLSLIHI